MNLTRELIKLNKSIVDNLPDDLKDLFKEEAEKLLQKGIEKTALKVGDKIPSFNLQNTFGKLISSDDLLSNGPLVLNFYRGAWCPYCNLELRAYQEVLSEIQELGAQLVAISPELPDSSMTLTEKYLLKFEILSDLDNDLAEQFGLKFQLSEGLQGAYKAFGFNLISTQGNDRYELPVPATYIVNTDGTILLAFVNSDYTKRLNPNETIEVLKTCTY